MPFSTLAEDAHRRAGWWAVPLAGDHGLALEPAAALVRWCAGALVRYAGFDPLIIGPIERKRDFDAGTAVSGRRHPAGELRRPLQRD